MKKLLENLSAALVIATIGLAVDSAGRGHQIPPVESRTDAKGRVFETSSAVYHDEQLTNKTVKLEEI